MTTKQAHTRGTAVCHSCAKGGALEWWAVPDFNGREDTYYLMHSDCADTYHEPMGQASAQELVPAVTMQRLVEACRGAVAALRCPTCEDGECSLMWHRHLRDAIAQAEKGEAL